MYPSLSDVRNVEGDTLKAITEIGEFGKLDGIQAAAYRALSDYNEERGGINVHLNFNVDIRLRGDRKYKMYPRRVDIGALVEQHKIRKKEIANASYSLLICKKVDPNTAPVVRKMHFDYEPLSQRNVGEEKPSVHMQVCGKFSREHYQAGYKDYKLNALYPAFEKPRIPSLPMSLALLVNWLLLEFQSDSAAQPILQNTRWKKLVSDAERTILKPYFDAASKYLGAANDGKRFCQGFQYGLVE